MHDPRAILDTGVTDAILKKWEGACPKRLLSPISRPIEASSIGAHVKSSLEIIGGLTNLKLVFFIHFFEMFHSKCIA